MTMGKGKLIIFDMSLLKENLSFIKNIGWLIKFRCNSALINQELFQLSSIHLIIVVKSWKSITLKRTNGIKTYIRV